MTPSITPFARLARYVIVVGATLDLRGTSDAVARPLHSSSRLALATALVAGALAVPFSHAATASPPVVTLTVSPPVSVPAGQSATLKWSSTGAATCSASDAWTGTKPTSGQAFTKPVVPGVYHYQLQCADAAGETTIAAVNLTVTAIGYSQTELVTNISGMGARFVDPRLEDPWGIVIAGEQPAALANRETNTSTSYDGGGVASQPVHLPAAAGGAAFNPTGVAGPFGTVTTGGRSGPAQLIFAGESGMIAAWAPAVDASNAVAVYSANDGASYRGLAAGVSNVYAADFHNGKVDVFDGTFKKQPRASFPFSDPGLPADYAPFGIMIGYNDIVYVAYANRVPPANGAVSGAGLGLIDAFDLSGNFLKRLVAPGGVLNAPWGLALAPAHDTNAFQNPTLFVANTGDNHIHAFNTATGALAETVSDSAGAALAIPALHGIAFGNRYANQPDVSLFFTAGPSNGTAGRYGRIDFGAPPRLHAPPTESMSLNIRPCFFWLACGAPHYTATAIATVASPAGIAKVDFFTAFFLRPPMQTSIAAPYMAAWYLPLSRRGVSVSATVTDVDGNIATISAAAVVP